MKGSRVPDGRMCYCRGGFALRYLPLYLSNVGINTQSSNLSTAPVFKFLTLLSAQLGKVGISLSLSILSMSTSKLTWCELVYWDCTLKHMDLVKCKCNVITKSVLSMLEIMKSQMNQNKTKP